MEATVSLQNGLKLTTKCVDRANVEKQIETGFGFVAIGNIVVNLNNVQSIEFMEEVKNNG